MMQKSYFSEIEYSEISDSDKYKRFMKNLKNEILFMVYQHYKDEEIRSFLDNLEIEEEIQKEIKHYAKEIRNGKKKEYLDPKDEKDLMHYWFRQYKDYGRDKDSEVKHYPSLILFDYQVKGLNLLLKRLSNYINKKEKEKLNDIIDKILNEKYDSYSFIEYEFNQLLKGELEELRDKKIRRNSGKKRSVAKEFLTSLKGILMGGVYFPKKEGYFPTFMQDPKWRKDALNKLRDRKKKLIERYFPQLTKKNVNQFLEYSPQNKELRKYLKTQLSPPPINLTLFKYISWDFMGENMFYDGCYVQKEDSQLIRTINLHPLSLFFCLWKGYTVFIDQLLYHELVHVFIEEYFLKLKQMDDIQKKISSLLGDNFKGDKDTYLSVVKDTILRQWIEVDKHKYYKDKTGGHTERFMDYMQCFKNCEMAMKIRGKIETLYAGFYYRLYSSDMMKGYWYLCNPDKPELNTTEIR